MFGFHNLKPAAAVAGLLLAAVACGRTAGTGGSGGGVKGTIEIGVEAPLSGTEASQGLAVLNGVQLAVADHATIAGFKIVVKSYDDAVQGTRPAKRGAERPVDGRRPKAARLRRPVQLERGQG